MANIIADTSITTILGTDEVVAAKANEAHDELQGMMDEIQAHHNGALTHGGSLTVSGDLTVNGTTTTVNSSTLDVTDANITLNNGGNQASANGIAGLLIEMSDATDGSIIFDNTLASKWKIGVVGSEVQVVDISSGQTFTNKVIDANNNTVTLTDTAHGTRGGGTLHADATTSVDGFMSAADKTKLDGLSAGGDLLGSWLSRSDNTNYLAATDGFVTAYCVTGVSATVVGMTDSTSPADVIRVQAIADTGGGNNKTSITFPVKSGDYWKVTGASTGAVWWIPLGT